MKKMLINKKFSLYLLTIYKISKLMGSIESWDKFSLQSYREKCTIEELQKGFDKMQQFIDSVISKFQVSDFMEVKKNLQKGFYKYASNWVDEKQRQQFIKLIQEGQLYINYQNKQKQLSKISDDDVYVLQIEARVNIQLLMEEKHQILDQEKLFQCIMSNRLEDAGIFIKYTKRDNFMEKVKVNQKIKRYWMRTNSQKSKGGSSITFNKIQYSKWITDPQKQVENYFQIIKDIYGTIMKSQNTATISMNEQILSKIKLKYNKTASITIFSEMMRLKILEQIGQSSNKYIQYNGNPPLKKIETSKIKDKLLCFDMNKYYERVSNTYYSIHKQILQQSLNIKKLLTLKMKVREQFGAVKKKEIFQIINKFLRKFDYQMINQSQFDRLSQAQISCLEIRYIKGNKQLNSSRQSIKTSQTSSQQPKSSLSQQELKKIRQLMYSFTFESRVDKIQTEIEFQQLVKSLTKWSFIKQLINQYIHGKLKEINQHLLNRLNGELSQLSIQINSSDNILQFIEQFEKNQSNQNKNQKIKPLNFVQSSYLKNHQKDLRIILQGLSYFDCNVIRNNIIKRKDIEDKSFFYIVSLSQVIMQLKRQYKQKTDLFNSDEMRQSIYTEIKKNKSFDTLFQKINDIIAQSPSKLDKMKMKEIYLGINILLANFNEDLALASHRLTQTFTNHIHLYAIHCIWKKISDEELNIANKQYESYCKSKEQQFAALIHKHNNCQ